MRLARKFILAMLVGIALVLGVHAAFRVKREFKLFEDDMVLDHAVLARTLAQAMARVWEEKGRDQALHLLEPVGTPDGRFRVRWLDGQTLTPGPFSRERHYTNIPITVRGQLMGWIELSESRAYERAYVRGTLIRTAWETLAAVGVAALLAVALGFSMVGRPLAALAQKARRIGAGDLSGPLALRQRDEIGELAREIDAMCARPLRLP